MPGEIYHPRPWEMKEGLSRVDRRAQRRQPREPHHADTVSAVIGLVGFDPYPTPTEDNDVQQ